MTNNLIARSSCFLGFHNWRELRTHARICQRCKQEQHRFMVMKCRGAFQVMSGFGRMVEEWRNV